SETRVLVAVSGASGVEYARRLIELLGDRADVIMSKDAQAVIEIDTGLTMKEFAAAGRAVYGDDNLAAAPAAGSSLFRAVVVEPPLGVRCTGPAWSGSELRGPVEVLVALGIGPLASLVGQDSGRDACDHREPVDEGHVVRLAQEPDHVAEGRLGDDLVQSVVQDQAALSFARDLQNRPQPDGIEVLRVNRVGAPARHLHDGNVLHAELQTH